MTKSPMRPAMRRYTWRVLAAMSLYVVALIGVKLWFRAAPPHGVLAYLAAALPALPILATFAIIARLIVEMDDEYVRMLLVRQSLVATAFMLSVTTVWGFLSAFGLAPSADFYWATVLWFSGLGVGGLTNWYLEGRARG